MTDYYKDEDSDWFFEQQALNREVSEEALELLGSLNQLLLKRTKGGRTFPVSISMKVALEVLDTQFQLSVLQTKM